MTTLESKDAQGREVLVGATVVIPEIPGWLVNGLHFEDVARLREAQGVKMRVLEIDAFGYLWFGNENEGRWFCLRPEEVNIVVD